MANRPKGIEMTTRELWLWFILGVVVIMGFSTEVVPRLRQAFSAPKYVQPAPRKDVDDLFTCMTNVTCKGQKKVGEVNIPVVKFEDRDIAITYIAKSGHLTIHVKMPEGNAMFEDFCGCGIVTKIVMPLPSGEDKVYTRENPAFEKLLPRSQEIYNYAIGIARMRVLPDPHNKGRMI